VKRSKRVEAARAEAARAEAAATPETWVQAATGKVVPLAQAAAAAAAPLAQKAGPLAQSAAARAVPLTTAAAAALPLARGAAAKVGPFTHHAIDTVNPYAQQAADAVTAAVQAVAGKVTSYTDMEAVAPYAQQAADAVTGAAQAVADRLTPYAEMAAGRIAPLAASGVQAAQGAVDRVGPAVGAARGRVSEEMLPKISSALTAAAASPLAVQAASRGRATVAAARGELSLPVPATPKKPNWLKRFAVVAAVGGTVAIVARKLMGSGDSGWQAARPSMTPSSPPSTTTAPSSTTPEGTRDGSPLAGVTTDAAAAPVDESAIDTASGTASYGEGSYVGTEPPSGYRIKGNANSNKYHLPEGSGYDETIAEVWFDTPESAERAGFTRAQG